MQAAANMLAPRRRRPKAPQRPDSITPHRCVVLAVDSGKQGGWSIWAEGRLVQFGELAGYDYDSVLAVVRAATQLAELGGLPCVLVLEQPATYRAGGKRSFTTILGLGASRGVWRAAWQGARESERRIVDAPIATWRSRVLGRGSTRLTRDEVRPLEQHAARGLVIVTLGPAHALKVGPDSAPAVCIGKWASHAGQVAKKLPKGAVSL